MSSEAGLPGPAESRVPPALAALVAPDVAMERQARTGKAKFTFLIAFFCALLAGAAQSRKVDARDSTLQRLETSDQLKSMSDRQIEEETKSAESKFIVMRMAGAILDAPVQLGLGCVSMFLLSWFLRGRLRGSAVVPVVAATLLPNAIANILAAVTAFQHATLPAEATPLVPRSVSGIAAALGHPIPGVFARLGGAMDFFSLWTAVLFGFGLAAASSMPVRRALTGTLVAWVCWQLLTNVAIGGKP